MASERFSVPELTMENFVDWESKMKSVLKVKGLFQLVSTSEDRPRDAKGRFKKFEDDEIARKIDLAHATIITRVSSTISGRLKKNGGDECPIQLWRNIQEFGASKKQANIFRAWYQLKNLKLSANNIQDFISNYWNSISTLQWLQVDLPEESLGHDNLAKLPPELVEVRTTLIASGTSSLIPVTYETVLELLDSFTKAKPSLIPSTTASHSESASRNEDIDGAHMLLTQARCPPGRHLPSASHTAKACFSLHPELLQKYRDHLNKKNEAESHLTVTEPTAYSHLSIASEEDEELAVLL